MKVSMKKISIYLITLFALWFVACSEDKKIGEIDSLTPDYDMQEGESEVDDRILEMYKQYGTYILYDYARLDFYYGLSTDYIYKCPKQEYVEDMLDLVQKIWLDFFPTEFHQKYLPYKLFFSEKLEVENWDGTMLEYYVCEGDKSFALGYCSDVLREMTPADKLKYKNMLHYQLWKSWYKNRLEFPEKFFELSDYTKAAVSNDVDSPDYTRTRGFVAKRLLEYDIETEWCLYTNWQTGLLDKNDDLNSFLIMLVTRTKADWEADLQYELVKKKYDILRDWFQEKYNFDITKIGDATYE